MSKTVTIQGAASEVMNLGLYLSGVDLAAEGEVERIDQLAKRLEHMSEVDCDKFAGMLDANSISGTRDILRLTEHLDDYVILPGCGSAQSIGRYLVGCGAFPVPEKLIGYINYEAVGIEFCDAHGGAACSRGFVVRKEGLPKAVLDDLHTSKQTYEMTLWSEDVISLNKKISDILSQVQFLTQLQQAGSVDPDTFISSNNKFSEQLRRLKQEKARLLDTDSDDLADRTRDLMDALEDGPDFLDSFDAELFDALVEKIIVDSNERLRFRLKNGLELTEQIERTRR